MKTDNKIRKFTASDIDALVGICRKLSSKVYLLDDDEEKGAGSAYSLEPIWLFLNKEEYKILRAIA